MACAVSDMPRASLIRTTYGINSDGIRPEDVLHLRLTFFLDLE